MCVAEWLKRWRVIVDRVCWRGTAILVLHRCRSRVFYGSAVKR